MLENQVSETPGAAATAAATVVQDSKKKQSPSLSSGSLTAHELTMVERSWMKVEALGVENVGVLLFKNIFAIEPACLHLFSFKNEPGLMNSTKLKRHVVKVVQTVGVAVANLRNLNALVPVLQGLALKHVGYNIVPSSNSQHKHYYGVVGHALLKTLREGLGKGLTQELEVAWAKVYTLVADTMIAASNEQPPSVGGTA